VGSQGRLWSRAKDMANILVAGDHQACQPRTLGPQSAPSTASSRKLPRLPGNEERKNHGGAGPPMKSGRLAPVKRSALERHVRPIVTCAAARRRDFRRRYIFFPVAGPCGLLPCLGLVPPTPRGPPPPGRRHHEEILPGDQG
jgi:hypothetical protein